LLTAKGDYESAELLDRRALEGREKSLGSEHTDTLTSAYTSAMTLNSLGRLSEAVQLLRRFAGLSKNACDFVAYHLACYECLSGNTEEAKNLISEHLKLHPEMKDQALADEDFVAIKDFIASL
jgi:tetratricopeptide (TPR) repeat protein